MPLATEKHPLEEEFFTTDAARWQRLCPWLRLLRAFRIAVDCRCLLVSLIGVLAWPIGEHILRPRSHETSPAAAETEWQPVEPKWPWEAGFFPPPSASHGPTDLSRITRSPLAALRDAFSNGPAVLWPISRILSEGSFLVNAPTALFLHLRRWGLLLWSLLVASLVGGTICRFAAVESANPGSSSVIRSARFAARNVLSFLFAPLIPFVAFALLWILNAAFGLLARIPGPGGALAAAFWPISVLIGVAMALIAIGVAAGWPLMIAGISSEKSDGFDGFSRSYSYVFNRPWYALFLSIFAVLYGSALLYVFAAVLSLGLQFAVQSTSTGAGDGFIAEVLQPGNMAEWIPWAETESAWATAGGSIVAVVLRVVKAMPAAFAFSFFWTATTLIYILLRRREDGTPVAAIPLDGARSMSSGSVPLVGVPAAAERERTLDERKS